MRRGTGNDQISRRLHSWLVGLAPLIAMVLALGLGNGMAHASPTTCGGNGVMTTTATTVTCTYTTVGADTFTVPAGVSSLTVEAVGAAGGSGYNGQYSPPTNGGLGGDVNATVNVSGGSTLQVSVGAVGQTASPTCNFEPGAGGAGIGAGGSGGYHVNYTLTNGTSGGTEAGGGGGAGGCSGGGGGGGASSLYLAPSTWFVVAGGGGGGGDSGAAGGTADAANTADGGNGGAAYGLFPGGAGGTSNGDGDAADSGGAGGSAPGGGGGGGGYAGGGGGNTGSGGGAGSSYGPAGATFAPASGAAEVVITYNIPNDNDLSLSGVPGNMTVNATSPAGAVVSYTAPTVVDEDSPLPAVTCTPASGSTFAIGTTMVTCTATDSDDLHSPTSATFNVTVKGAADQTTDVQKTVDSWGLNQQQASYDTQLQAVQTDISTNNGLACSDLTAFINHVKAQSGKQLTTAQAGQLLAAATQIQAVLGC